MLIRSVCFITAFLLLACTVVAMSAAVYEPPKITQENAVIETQSIGETFSEEPTESLKRKITQVQEHPESESDYTPRMTAPDADNACYYSDENPFYAADYGIPNCTCYAWGRAYEIIGEEPELSPYDACTWYDYNMQNGVYDYGDTPRQGAIACWAYSDGGSGHVAVVEEVEDDRVLLSNSAYEGAEFYMDTVPSADPSAGRDGWIFQGYIYVNEAGSSDGEKGQ